MSDMMRRLREENSKLKAENAKLKEELSLLHRLHARDRGLADDIFEIPRDAY